MKLKVSKVYTLKVIFKSNVQRESLGYFRDQCKTMHIGKYIIADRQKSGCDTTVTHTPMISGDVAIKLTVTSG
jgi:hypothetical protein